MSAMASGGCNLPFKISNLSMLSTQGTEQNSNLVEAFAKMGLLCDRAGKIEDAAFHYQQALALGKNSPELQHNLGRVLQQQGILQGRLAATGRHWLPTQMTFQLTTIWALPFTSKER
jgi:tetratricopeptide (TPR) repeat protein